MCARVRLFCKRDIKKRPVFCKETCIFKHLMWCDESQICVHVCVCVKVLDCVFIHMGWLRLVGSLK